MFKKYKNGIFAAAVYIGAIMGAGFATGQELVKYFVHFGNIGLLAILCCGGIFALVGFKVLFFMHTKKLSSYREFLRCIMGKKLGYAAEIISFCFIIALYSSMLAASGALSNQWLGIDRIWGSVFMLLVCSFLVSRGIQSLGIVNLLLCPLLIGGSVIIGLWLYYGSISVFSPTVRLDDNILGSAVIYISYNVISCVSLLCAVSKQIESPADAITGGVLGGLAIGLIGLVLAMPLHKYFYIISASELPVLTLIPSENHLIKTSYIILLTAAILTTALGNCYSAVECLCPNNKKERSLWAMLVGIAALLLSLMGFQNIVGKLYYLFGCLGIAELAVIVNLKLRKD